MTSCLVLRIASCGDVWISRQVCRWQFKLQEILPADEQQRARFGQLATTCVNQMGDVFAAERLEGQGIGHRPHDRIVAVDLGQRHDLAHMRQRIPAAVEQAGVIFPCQWRQTEKALQYQRIAGMTTLSDQGLRMIGILDVLMALERTAMAGDQFAVVIDTDAIRIDLHRHRSSRQAGGNRIAIALERDPELSVGTNAQDAADIEEPGIDRLQMSAFLDPEVFRSALRFAMLADVGHRLQPQPDGRIEHAEVGQFQAGQEIAFDISDAPFRASLLIAFPGRAGDDFEAVMAGEVKIAGIELRVKLSFGLIAEESVA